MIEDFENERKGNDPAVYADGPAHWREWLEKNHQTEKSVWLILYKKGHPKSSLTYDKAVNEALCFGWIDSKPNKRDENSFYQFFARRNPKSNWSRVNKEKVARLIEEGKMAEAGFASIALAKENGCWTALDKVENLELPPGLELAFKENQKAFGFWEAFPRSVKRGILEWIYSAKTEETLAKRISETVRLAEENLRAQFQPKPKA